MSRAPAANPQRRAAGALFLLLAAGLLLGGGVLLEWIGLPPAVLSMGGAGRCPATVCACRTAPQLPPPSSPPPDDHSLHVEAASQWEDEALLSPQLDEAAERDSQRRRGKQRQGKQQRDGGAKPSSPSKGSTKKQASLQQHERQERHELDAQQQEVPLLCGGSDAIPRVADSLADSTRRLEDGLQRAFAPYAAGFTLEDLMHTADALQIDGTHDTMVWVEVRNQTIVFPRRKEEKCDWFCNEWLRPLKEAVERGMASGRLRIPGGLPMLWNVFDYSGCTPNEGGSSICTAPMLSIIKHRSHCDVPVPPFVPAFEPHFVPWEEKEDVAFFRGTPWCNVHGLNGSVVVPSSNCSREHLPLLSREAPGLLNVTLNRAHGRAPGTPGPSASHFEHAGYKYLLNLDGITASRRFATLLSLNSLVLKQESEWEEWYYAGLQPCVHYLPFWQHSEDDVLPLVRALQGSQQNQAVAQRLAANAQTFAAAHFTEDAVYRHWQRVIDRYVELYRGPADPAATTAALTLAEEIGRNASAVGAEVEAKCWAEGGGGCWYVGRDAAKAVVNAARQAAKAAVAKAAEAAVWADVPTDTEAGEGGADPTDTSGTGEAAQTDSDAGPSDDVMI